MGGVTDSIGGKGAPAPPDFTQAAERQAQSGHINTPFGTWNGNGIQFSGGLGQGAQNLMGQIGSQGALPTGMEARDQAIQSAYGQAASRLDPQWQQRETGLRAQLANQGLDPGSEAATNAYGDFSRSRNDAYGGAMANAIGQGTQAGNAIFQQGVQSQNQPYSQLNSLASLLQGNQGRETQYLNAAGAGYQGQQNQYATEQAGKNSLLSGAATLAPMAIMASDERLKTDIVRSLLEAIPGVPFASWEWKGEPGKRHVGVIAQDLVKVRPDLVLTDPVSGHMLVDYSFLGEMAHG
jgi:hypothetical protein